MLPHPLRAALLALAFVGVLPGAASAAPPGSTVTVAPAFETAVGSHVCGVTFPFITPGRCSASASADAATGTASFSSETTYNTLATMDAGFSDVDVVRKTGSITYRLTVAFNTLRWRDAGGNFTLSFSARHRGCDCSAGFFDLILTSDEGMDRSGESVEFTLTLTDPSGGRMPAGIVDLSVGPLFESAGGTDVAPGSFDADIALTIIATSQR